MSTKARSAFGSFMVQAVAHCGMECKFKQLNVRAEKVFLTLRSLRYALCVMTRGSDLEVGRSYRAIARERNGEYYWFWIGTHEEYNRFRF